MTRKRYSKADKRVKGGAVNNPQPTVPVDMQAARLSLLEVISGLCNPDGQPHQWVGRPEILRAVLTRLYLASMGVNVNDFGN